MTNSNCEILLIVRHVPISAMSKYRKMHIINLKYDVTFNLENFLFFFFQLREIFLQSVNFLFAVCKNNLEMQIEIKEK